MPFETFVQEFVGPNFCTAPSQPLLEEWTSASSGELSCLATGLVFIFLFIYYFFISLQTHVQRSFRTKGLTSGLTGRGGGNSVHSGRGDSSIC